MAERGYEPRNARVQAQMEKMSRLAAAGICAFCREHFEKFHDHPVEFSTADWIVSKNDYPYNRTQLHLLLVPKRHVVRISDLTKAERAGMMEALAEIEQRFGLDSYAVGMRVGDPAYNGGTVEHLHAHVIVAEREAAEHEPVRFKMSTRRTRRGQSG